MDREQQDWLTRNVEDPIDPEQRICDPHHHLWDHPTDRYLLEELRRDTGAGHRIERTVFVECTSCYRDEGPEALRPVGETEFVAAQAEASAATPGAEIAGIVGFADLTLGDAVAEVLDAHVEAGRGRFRGIRHATAWDASPQVRVAHTRPPEGLLGDRSFRAGVGALGRAGLSFDAWLYHPQLPELTDLARAHPDVSIILDHLGGPLGVGPYSGRRTEVREVWRGDLAEVATCDNVTLKLGGIGMPVFGLGWHHRPEPPSSQELAEAWGDELRWCIDVFGPDRCMFESNFPVDRRSCSYTTLWNTFQRVADGYSRHERDLLFHDTAVRTYRLEERP